ncbi:hypothetical protein MtrunA17_Chr6g0464281 [Medicago truncatula]|uniref:Plant/F1M20-13 protein n=1 Tax=Medicago truncatula TaxID=3880 RepID=A0A072U9Z8_MEDTR|nr:plant/F1M20-13 protein [Medicago truncatula]RHN51058.1 hypothetical protein MtrunA17_Chr6g0464281 [Medicago truncatula]
MRFATKYQGSSILNLRATQVHSMENSTLDKELSLFQKHVTDRFNELSLVSNDNLLSLSWVSKLLDTFLCCQEEFKMILHNHRSMVCKPPLDRLVNDFYEMSVKALDVCNAIRDGVEQIRQWEKSLEIVLCALDNKRIIGEGQFRRAKKALVDLEIGMIDASSKDSNNVSSFGNKNRSFGRNNVNRDKGSSQVGHFRSLSRSVSRNWSAENNYKQ